MGRRTVWNGTAQEGQELCEIIKTHCECATVAETSETTRCGPHWMLLSDQRALDGLLFARRIAARLLKEEFDGSDERTGGYTHVGSGHRD
jgi:hypothetical protein